MSEDQGVETTRAHDDGLTLIPVTDHPLPIDWDESEEAWIHHFGLVMSETWDGGGYRATLHRPPQVNAMFREVIVTGGAAPALRLYWTTEGIRPVVAFSGTPNLQQVGTWASILQETERRLSQPLSAFRWTAYIAGARCDIGANFTLDHLTFEPTGTAFAERKEVRPARFHAWNVDWSYPLRVTATSDALNWHSAANKAGEDLYAACAVLTVAYDHIWAVKQAPMASWEADTGPPPADELLGSGWENLERQPLDALPWLDDAFACCSAPEVAGPLSAYYRGVSLIEIDPPTALNLLVATVEGIGSRYVKLTRCDTCGFMKGARQRYRFAIGLMADGEDAKALNKLYDLRSGAAHGDLIAGQVLTVGDDFGRGTWFRTTPPPAALRGRLWDLQQASRRLMVRALTGDLPTP